MSYLALNEFIMLSIDSFLLNLNGLDQIQVHCPNHRLHEFTHNFKQEDMPYRSYECIQPDSSNNHHILLCFVRPIKDLDHRTNVGLMMKECLNYQLTRCEKVEQAGVIALLFEGNKGTLIHMFMPVPKLYVMVPVDEFTIPTCIDTLDSMVSSFTAMMTCRSWMEKQVENIQFTPDDPEVKNRAVTHLTPSFFFD